MLEEESPIIMYIENVHRLDDLDDEIHSILNLGPEKEGGDTEYKRSLLKKGKDQ